MKPIFATHTYTNLCMYDPELHSDLTPDENMMVVEKTKSTGYITDIISLNEIERIGSDLINASYANRSAVYAIFWRDNNDDTFTPEVHDLQNLTVTSSELHEYVRHSYANTK